LVADKNEWAYLQTPAYCWYDNDEATNKAYYGAVYNWYAVNSGKLCPTGWHVPSDAEWTNLTTYLGGESVAGDKLKEIFSLTIDGRTGFAALPGGRRIIGITSSDYLCIGETGSWWSSTEYSSEDAWFREMSTNSDDVNRNYIFKDWGNSVRCVKD
jgi:uncharacterized protein (TIGR02145 family)